MRLTRKQTKGIFLAAAMICIGAMVSTGTTVNATGGYAGDPASTFKSKCASCHATDGSGGTAAGKSLKLRDLRSAEVQKQSDDQLYASIAKGKGKMPGYEKTLGAETCKALVGHMRKLAGK